MGLFDLDFFVDAYAGFEKPTWRVPPGGRVRPSWDDYFFGLAFLASRRSPDLSTQHGCVLVDPATNHILATGYNGFKRGEDDAAKASQIPKPYPEIRHSEVNAVDNCRTNLAFVGGVKAYITGTPCSRCAEYLAESHVRHWVVADRRGYTNPPPGEAEELTRIVSDHGVFVERRKPDLGWIVEGEFLEDLRGCGFID